VHGARSGFRTQQVGCADLYAGRAKRHGCGGAFGVCYPARGNDWSLNGPHDLWHQREGSNLRGQIL